MSKFNKVWLISLLAFCVCSCSTYLGNDGRRGVSSSLVDYLYPDGRVPPKHEESTPHLKLPLTVGLAFVPPRNNAQFSLPESKKAQLLENVRQKFIGIDYVKNITVIPETYMKSSKGFDGIGQIARLYGLDIVALVSYDQVSVTSDNTKSILYWSIVGAYFIKGTDNQVNTFVDTAVFDVNSQKMLFRAPGVSEVQKSSTLLEIAKIDRESKAEGFETAMTDMTQNLVTELDRFKNRIKEDKSVQISHRDGYGGSGAIHSSFLLVLLGLGIWIRLIRK